MITDAATDALFRVPVGTPAARAVDIEGRPGGTLSLQFELGLTRAMGITHDGPKWVARRSVKGADGLWLHTFLSRPLGSSVTVTGFPTFEALQPGLLSWLEDEFGALEAELVLHDITNLVKFGQDRMRRAPVSFPRSTHFTVRTP